MAERKFHIHADALEEIDRAHAYYLKANPSAAEKFSHELDRAIMRILSSPDSFAPFLKETRCCRITDFPYIVVFDLADNIVDIIAVAHTSRREGYWQRRRKS